ncbi:MAG TPA: 50S ribosome-binding GTPase [Bacilli bacterium]|nr:50S ribosome-binding GTPase [Bacilli bacterium]
MNKICYGCGVKLQCNNPDGLGYVPENKIDDAAYCVRCFRMMHYGEHKDVITPKDEKEIIRKINKDDKFVIFLVDFLNISEHVINLFNSIKGEKLLVVNKCELLPKNVKPERIRLYLKEYYHVNSDIKIKGGSLTHGAKAIYGYLGDRGINEAYILGISNSGKSTLINDLIKVIGSNIKEINTNSKANTTLDFMRVKIDNNLTLIDSPGFIIENALENDVTTDKATAYSFHMKAGEGLSILDGRYYFKVLDGTSLVFYTNVNSKVVAKKNFKEVKTTNELNIIKNNQDIVLYGIGFITVKDGTRIKTNINSESMEIRDSMFGGYYE